MSAKHRTVVQFDYKPPISEVSMENNIKQYKNPLVLGYVGQYVAPFGYHFERNSVNYGRIAWFSNVDGITIEKDETKTSQKIS